jgi:ABC-type sugar transport system ATPase subunit
MATLTLFDVQKRFGEVEAVRPISLEIQDGEFLVLVGPSGCGKSTLLRMIAGLESVSGGRILLQDRDVTGLAPRDRGMAMVFQDYALYPHMTVAENLGFALRMQGVGRPEIDTRVRQTAQTLELGELLDRRPRALSGGQRQRVALGRALIRQPQVFLFDEPLSNLDAKLRVGMRAEIRRLQRLTGITTVYVTHDQVEAMTMADRVAVLKEGQIQQIGRPSEVYGSPANLFVGTFMGSPPMSVVAAEMTADGVRIGDGPCAPWPSGRARPPSGPIHLGIRSEHVSLDDAQAGGWPFQARVAHVEEHGAEAIAMIKFGVATMAARIPPGRLLGGELAVRFRLDVERMHCFDPQTGVTLSHA